MGETLMIKWKMISVTEAKREKVEGKTIGKTTKARKGQGGDSQMVVVVVVVLAVDQGGQQTVHLHRPFRRGKVGQSQVVRSEDHNKQAKT